jgi:hypothetical protein
LSKKITSSPAATPFFVPPKLSTSTPAFQVIVFGAHQAMRRHWQSARRPYEATFCAPAQRRQSLNFIRRVNRSELRRLCDANGAHHVPVQLDLLRDEFFCLAQVDLSVIGFRQKQFGSPGIKLRSAAFVRLDVGALVTDHSVEGLAKLGQTERVAPVPVNTK